MVLLSPGIRTNELIFQNYAIQLGVTLPVFVGGATKGPVDAPTRISTQEELFRRFGNPVESDYGLLAAAQYLQYGSEMVYLRVANGESTADATIPGATGASTGIDPSGWVEIGGTGGTQPVDGDSVTLDYSLDTPSPVVFEFDLEARAEGGVTVAPASLPEDNDTFELIDANAVTRKYEFDSDASGATQVGTDVVIDIQGLATAPDIAAAIIAAIEADRIGGNIQIRAEQGATTADVRLIQVVPGSAGNTAIAEPEGSGNLVTVDFTGGEDGAITGGAVRVTIGATPAQTAANLATAINAQTTPPFVATVASATPTRVDVIVEGTESDGNAPIIESTTALRLTLSGATFTGGTDVDAGAPSNAMVIAALTPGTWANGNTVQVVQPSTAQNPTSADAFDLIVRAAVDESGVLQIVEQFRNMVNDSSSVRFVERVVNEGIKNENPKSQWIRATQSTNLSVPTAGTYTLGTGSPAVGTVDFTGNPLDGDLLAITDSLGTTVTFEFDLGGGVTPGHVAVVIGTLASDTQDNFLAAVNGSALAITATNGVGTTDTVLTNDNVGRAGNVLITESDAGANITVAGMAGGVDVGLDGIDALTNADYIGTAVGGVTTGLQSLRDAERVEFNLLAIPGMTAAIVQLEMIDVCQSRGDALAILDPPFGLTVGEVVQWHNGELTTVPDAHTSPIDASYACLFWSWGEVFDESIEKNIWLPPSGFAAGIFAQSDILKGPWFAAAGTQRGALRNIIRLEHSANQSERDQLLGGDNAINPFIEFVTNDVSQFIAFGNDTLYRAPERVPTTRIHIRRMLLYVKKVVATAIQYLLFDPNDPISWRDFEQTVTPIMKRLQSDRGIESFEVRMDATTNPDELRIQNTARGRIFITPLYAMEKIEIDFVVTTSGTEFPDLL
jgi:phage tail sheath protein FI